MKTLLLYNTKNGATKKCAKYIEQNGNNVKVYHVTEFKEDLTAYKQVLIGTPVYMGNYDKKIKQFIEKNIDSLLKVKLIIYVCCMNEKETDEVVKNNLPFEIIEHAEIYHVGGAYYFDKLNWIQRFIVKKIAKIKETKERFDYNLLDEICKETI